MLFKLSSACGAGALLSLLQALRHFLCALPLLLLFYYPGAVAGDNFSPKDNQANRIVSGIISFTHWPGLTQAPQLCILSSAQHLSFPSGHQAVAAPFSVVWLHDASDVASNRCDALYFGDQSPQQQTALLSRLQGKALLAIAENNPECTIGAAFCLIFTGDHTAFSVNLDSLARSGVRVSPDVLLLSRKGSK